MISRKHRIRLAKMRRDGYLKRDNPMTPHINALLRVGLDISTPVLESWVNAWITMDGTGNSLVTERRESPLYEDAIPSDACAIYLLLGREDDKNGNSNELVLAHWLRLGLSAKGAEVAVASDVTARHANRIREVWENDLRALLADAACLGLTGQELYDAVTQPGYFPEHIHRRLTALRTAREETLEPTYDREIEAAWRSFRDNASRQGVSPDHYEVKPPRWFVKSMQ